MGNTDKPLYIAFLWHMHQPFYRDLVTGKCPLPWVRLHGIKDYYDMAAILKDYPNIHQTFNLVPSLLKQIDYYLNGASDDFLDLSLKPTTELSEEDKIFLLYNFFMGNWQTMVKIHPRYRELLERRGSQVSKNELRKIIKRFTSQDFLDLQVWFNLSWFDPLFQEEDELLRSLIKKGRGFSEEEKQAVIEKQREILGQILPLYKELREAKQIEITVSPFYHPILPLLCDTNSAKIALPNINLPKKRFAHPEDARVQIERAVSYYRELFGEGPLGMWPSEGSVSEDIIPLIADAGIKWIATDEGILSFSLGKKIEKDHLGRVLNPQLLYRPYLVKKEGRELAIIFRDHVLSDLIGFVYSKWETKEAVKDLLGRLGYIRERASSPGGELLVSIILDGENAWEYYKNDGRDFLKALYEAIEKDPTFKAVTISEYLKDRYPREVLPKLFAGSWIDHNFRIWIGHREDNTAWDYLSQAREALVEAERKGRIERETISKAWEEIYIAQGSDWCWWYGDDHSSPNDEEFDHLYRKHLMNVYKLIGKEVPDYLYLPILSEVESKPTMEPIGFIQPVIDGEVTNYYEWLASGYYEVTRAGGTMHQTESIVRSIFYGFDLKKMYIRIDTKIDLRGEDLGELLFDIRFLEPNFQRVEISLSSARPKRVRADLFKEEEGRWIRVGEIKDVALGKIIELSLAFEEIKVKPLDAIKLVLVVKRDGLELERWPRRGPITFSVPTEDFEAYMWRV